MAFFYVCTCAAGDATRDHPPPPHARSSPLRFRSRKVSPLPSIPFRPLSPPRRNPRLLLLLLQPQSKGPPRLLLLLPRSLLCRFLTHPGAPAGCDSFPWRQRIPSLLRFFLGSLWIIEFGRISLLLYQSVSVDHTLPTTELPYPRHRLEEPGPCSSQETGHWFVPAFQELVTCRCLLAAPSWFEELFSGKTCCGVMGAFCSCLQADYSDHHGNQASGVYRNCMCLRCFTQQLINAYTVLFRVGTVHAVSQAIEATPIDSSESSFDTYRSPPRPLPYDDPRFSPPLRDWFASRHDPSSHSPEESEPLRADFDEEMETMSSVDKPSKTNYDTKMKRGSSTYGDKLSRKESGNYFTYFSPSAEDEDVCPTCLEDYTSENPRIVMQCSHHFHLGCIYEWMERSEACPVCGKKMEFNETT